MKRILLASTITLATWAGSAVGQPSLGTPVAPPPCASCDKSALVAPRPVGYGAKFCQSGVGQLANQMLTPVRLVTGNLLPTCCAETICREDVERMLADGHYSPAEITAAKIKLDESQAKVRRSAVRYLAGVNCHYYPEAEAGLIAALRCDRNECVRLEAALAMATCNCITPKIAQALNVAAMGTEIDGNPAEISERVRSAARNALARYETRGLWSSPQMLPPPDWAPPMPLPEGSRPATMPNGISIQAMSAFGMPTAHEMSRAENISSSTTNVPTGQRTLYHLFIAAMGQREAAPAYVPSAPPPRPPAIGPLGLTPLGSEVYLAIPRE